MRRNSSFVVAAAGLAVSALVGCGKSPAKPLATSSARLADPGPPKPKFGDQTRPPLNLDIKPIEAHDRSPDEWYAALEKLCRPDGHCDRLLVESQLRAAPDAVAKEMSKRCTAARAAGLARVKPFVAQLQALELASRQAVYHGAPGCVVEENNDRAGLAAAEQQLTTFPVTTPEYAGLRESLTTIGACHACDPDFAQKCEEARQQLAEVAKSAAQRPDEFCKIPKN
jgi:hypothetical protein